jgi:hypothetical protein
MTQAVQPTSTYHVLLIGCDYYPPAYRSLHGCVNDIDTIERALLDPPGVGIPPEQIKITRLASPHPEAPVRSQLQAQTQEPNKANIVQALQQLAGDEVTATDRVLIYYSGHGTQTRRQGSQGWYEALVPIDVQFLYNDELNELINDISRRTSDLTIVLDCCHSAGATREITEKQPQATPRFFQSDGLGQPPDPSIVSMARSVGPGAEIPSHLSQTLDPNYIVIVACQADEKANEAALPTGDGVGEQVQGHGFLSYSLVHLLTKQTDTQPGSLRWADIWPSLLDRVGMLCVEKGSPVQHPWIIGRPERHLFGGSWQRQDPGFRVSRAEDGSYTIAAGSLMGLTQDALLAIYGPSPLIFPLLNSPDDQAARVGLLKVIRAERASCSARADGASFDLPEGARARLVQPGKGEQLRVLLVPSDPHLAATLEQSPFLQVVDDTTPDPEVRVDTMQDGGWTIRNTVNDQVATVPAKYSEALRAGLESYADYNQVLRLAQNSNDPALDKSLDVRLLDCSDPDALADADSLGSHLPEVPRNADGIFSVPNGFPLVIKVKNTYRYPLQVSIFNCTASGKVEFMGEMGLQTTDVRVFWLGGQHRRPFIASSIAPVETTDRLIVVATTKRDADLSVLKVQRSVQQVVDKVVRSELSREMMDEVEYNAGPADAWTAVTIALKIGPKL